MLLSSLAFAGEDWQAQPIGPFSGINNRDTSFAIPAQNSQDALNVNITPGGKSVFKRKGFGLAYTLPITTSAVHGVYTFFDANGNTVDLFANDAYLSGSVSGSNPTTILSNGPNGATYQCTDNLGFAYCANSLRTTIIKTNGVTSSQISNVSSTGTMVATCVTRLAMAGFSDRPSGIDFSSDSDFTTWGTGSLGTSPVQLTVSAPGSKITHIVYAFGRLIWFKDTSFGYVLIGNQPLQTDWVIRTISYDVGTNDNSSVFREGVLYFRGQDGHIYGFDGVSYQRASREISGTISTEQNRTQGSFSQTTQTDWSNGYSFSSFVDTNTVAGDVQLLYPDNFSSYRNGSNGSLAAWSNYSYGAGNCISTVSISNGNLVLISTTIAACDQVIKTKIPTNNYKTGTTFYFVISSVTFDPAGGTTRDWSISFSSSSNGNDDPQTFNNYMYFQFRSSQTSTMYYSFSKDSADGVLCLSNCQSGNSSMPASIAIFLATTTYSVSINNAVVASGTHSYPNSAVYTYIDSFGQGGGTNYFTIDTYNVVPETATYFSQVKNASNLKSWDNFSADYLNFSGSNSFFIRSSPNPIVVNSSTPSWTSIVPGNIPSISTGTYFQLRDDFSLLVASSSSPSLQTLTQNWFEGTASDKAYATYFDDKIWWEVTAGTGATTNNKTLIYDMLNQTWTLYDLAVNGFYVRQNRLYFGSSTGGYVYKFGDVDNDNGSAINAYWKSKDFFGGNPFTNQELVNISVVGKQIATSSMTVTYSINGSSDVAYVVPLYQANSLFINKNKNLPAGTIAGDFNVKFGNNAVDQPFEVFGVQVGIRPKTWIPN